MRCLANHGGIHLSTSEWGEVPAKSLSGDVHRCNTRLLIPWEQGPSKQWCCCTHGRTRGADASGCLAQLYHGLTSQLRLGVNYMPHHTLVMCLDVLRVICHLASPRQSSARGEPNPNCQVRWASRSSVMIRLTASYCSHFQACSRPARSSYT